MGRMYMKHSEPTLTIHTKYGSAIIAIRRPEVGEFGYWVGVDFSVRDAVSEALAEWWEGEDEGPGWRVTENHPPRINIVVDGRVNDDTYPITFLAAYRAIDEGEEIPPDERDANIVDKHDARVEEMNIGGGS